MFTNKCIILKCCEILVISCFVKAQFECESSAHHVTVYAGILEAANIPLLQLKQFTKKSTPYFH